MRIPLMFFCKIQGGYVWQHTDIGIYEGMFMSNVQT